jgi:hypothetical protein
MKEFLTDGPMDLVFAVFRKGDVATPSVFRFRVDDVLSSTSRSLIGQEDFLEQDEALSLQPKRFFVINARKLVQP